MGFNGCERRMKDPDIEDSSKRESLRKFTSGKLKVLMGTPQYKEKKGLTSSSLLSCFSNCAPPRIDQKGKGCVAAVVVVSKVIKTQSCTELNSIH